MFSYRLSTQAFAAAELARWALKPIAAARYQPKPPRLICFFGRTEGDRQASSYQLPFTVTARRPTSTAQTSPPREARTAIAGS
jgi:hypothetical protein